MVISLGFFTSIASHMYQSPYRLVYKKCSLCCCSNKVKAPRVFGFLLHSWLEVSIVFQQDSNSSYINREYSRSAMETYNKCVSCGLLGLQVNALKIQNPLYITGWRLCHISTPDSLQVEHDLHRPTTKIFFNVRLAAAERAASLVAMQHRCLPLYGAQFLDGTRKARCV